VVRADVADRVGWVDAPAEYVEVGLVAQPLEVLQAGLRSSERPGAA
jgi:hypothetical protein